MSENGDTEQQPRRRQVLRPEAKQADIEERTNQSKQDGALFPGCSEMRVRLYPMRVALNVREASVNIALPDGCGDRARRPLLGGD